MPGRRYGRTQRSGRARPTRSAKMGRNRITSVSQAKPDMFWDSSVNAYIVYCCGGGSASGTYDTWTGPGGGAEAVVQCFADCNSAGWGLKQAGGRVKPRKKGAALRRGGRVNTNSRFSGRTQNNPKGKFKK